MGALRVRRPGLVAIRSLVVSGSMILYFGSLAFLPIAEVAAGLFTSPIFVLLISAVVLRAPLTTVRIAAALVGFVGVVMVLKPDAGGFGLITLVPVMAGFLYAVGAVMTSEWCAEESTPTVLTGFFLGLGLWGALGMAALWIAPQVAPTGADGFILRGAVWPSGTFLFWTTIQAVGSILGVGLIIRGYQWSEASYVAVFEYSLLIWVALWAYLLRGEVLDIWAAAGIALIIGSGVLLSVSSRRDRVTAPG